MCGSCWRRSSPFRREPSPKSHRYVSVSPASGSLLPEPFSVTFKGGGPEVGEAVTDAVGVVFAAPVCTIRRTSPPPA